MPDVIQKNRFDEKTPLEQQEFLCRYPYPPKVPFIFLLVLVPTAFVQFQLGEKLC